MRAERVKGEGPGPTDGERCCGHAQHRGVLKPALGREKAIGGMDAGRNAHRGGSGGAGSRGGKTQGQGNTGSCFAYTSEDGAWFCGPEAHSVHSLAGAFNTSSAEPTEKFLGSVRDEHTSESNPEQGLRGCCGMRAGRFAAHRGPLVLALSLQALVEADSTSATRARHGTWRDPRGGPCLRVRAR